MFARLAFAVAINVDPDVLIVDEALSVGDARFQSKSIKKMEEIREKGTTILFVSHATEQIKRFCTKAIWLENSTVKLIGDPAIVTDKYLDHISVKASETISTEQTRQTSGRLAKIKNFSLNKSTVSTFDSLEIIIKYEVFEEDLPDLLIGIAIFDNEKNYIFGPNTYLDNYQIQTNKGIHSLKYILPKISLLSGKYLLDVGIFLDKGIVNLDYINNISSFIIENTYFTEGKVYLEHSWQQ
jgi:teichoic acid transport system ATP-binding protein